MVPDYPALVGLLPTLHNLVDACGDVTLTAEEANKIRALGFADAKSGPWKCPPLPPHLTHANPLLEPLSAGWDERSHLSEVQHRERDNTPQVISQYDGMAQLGPEHSVETVDVPPPHCNAKRRKQLSSLSSEEPDWKRIDEAASKIEGTLKRAGKPMKRRRLQQLLWRYPATVFNAALDMLWRQQRIFL